MLMTCDNNVCTFNDMFTCEHMYTCDDVLYGSIFPFINMAAVFSLSSSEFSDQLLLLTLPPVGWRLEEKRGRVFSFCPSCQSVMFLSCCEQKITKTSTEKFDSSAVQSGCLQYNTTVHHTNPYSEGQRSQSHLSLLLLLLLFLLQFLQ